jgi:hypothetical protein
MLGEGRAKLPVFHAAGDTRKTAWSNVFANLCLIGV